MADEVLSQEEIEALVAQGAGSQPESNESEAEGTSGESTESGAGRVRMTEAGGDSVIRPMEFNCVHGSAAAAAVSGVDLIFDVQLQVNVEPGRTTMLVKDVLALGAGSVVELDKHAGEPVEVVVNNKVVARGEVVVIDENFGVRITEIVSADERMPRAKAA